jgi:transposase
MPWHKVPRPGREHVTAEWFLRYGISFSDSQQLQGKGARQQLAETIGRDGHHLLTQIDRDAAPAALRGVAAVETLRQVWVQQFSMEAGEVKWCDSKDCPPSSVMIASPYDLDSRESEKRGTYWRGYKVHVTETCDDDTPHVITQVETTSATDQDVSVVDTMHQALAQQNRLPGVHVVDGADASGEKLARSQREYQIDLLGPMRQDQRWPAHDAQAFDISHFQIDWEQEIVLCPLGKQRRPWKPSKGPRGKPTLQVSFYRKDCAACCVRKRCTRSTTAAHGLAPQRRASANTPSVLKQTTNGEPASKGPYRKPPLPWACGGQGIGVCKRPICIIWPPPWRSISNASWIGSGKSRVQKRASHTSRGWRLRPDSPTTSTEHTPL